MYLGSSHSELRLVRYELSKGLVGDFIPFAHFPLECYTYLLSYFLIEF
jgi:hypothetical protein